ncbi:MAG TPA: hypothetical protein ENK18_02280 [Deltaproteobacteria bacterium]|nr:hypothetical protein [Deltaproteobacteria bacterium]
MIPSPALSLLLQPGCGHPDPPALLPTADTAYVGTGDLDADCVADRGHALMFTCRIHLDEPDEVRVEAWHLSDPSRIRVFTGKGPALEHSLLLWGFKPDARVRWRASSSSLHRTGELHTGPLPDELAVTWEIQALTDDAQVEGVLVSTTCAPGIPHLLDRDGDIVWYAELASLVPGEPPRFLPAVQRTERDTILMISDRSRVIELSLGGEVLLDLRRGIDFDRYIHHDVLRHGDRIYVPRVQQISDQDEAFLIDGIYVFDDSGALVGELSTQGLWPLPQNPWALEGYWAMLFPGAYDVTHANSLSIDARGDLVVSFRHLHALVGFQADPDAPGFGAQRWALVGDPQSPAAPGDVLLTAEPGIGTGFMGQHDANFAPDGTLLMLDNRFTSNEDARVLQLTVDLEAQTAHIQESWSLDRVCPVQGSARALPAGHVLADCSTGGHLYELAPGSASLRWHAVAGCAPGLPTPSVPRAVPWPLWGKQTP